jgi:hypothetical protein
MIKNEHMYVQASHTSFPTKLPLHWKNFMRHFDQLKTSL